MACSVKLFPNTHIPNRVLASGTLTPLPLRHSFVSNYRCALGQGNKKKSHLDGVGHKGQLCNHPPKTSELKATSRVTPAPRSLRSLTHWAPTQHHKQMAEAPIQHHKQMAEARRILLAWGHLAGKRKANSEPTLANCLISRCSTAFS